MEKIKGLKIGTEENKQVLIDEFGSPTKTGLAFAGLAALSVLGGLIVAKNIFSYLMYRIFRKSRKKALKARKIKAKVRNKEQKKMIREKSAELKKMSKQLGAAMKEQDKLVLAVEEAKKANAPKTPAQIAVGMLKKKVGKK